MKIVFMGTPDFAVPTLEELLEAGHDVDLVITKPDAVRDRGKKVKFSPVKETALNYEIPVLQPETLKNADDVVEAIKKVAPDVICVVAYGKILPQRVLDIPPLGCVNIHGSILPALRGSAPVQWAVLRDLPETGVTAMYMSAGMDEGDIIDVRTTPIGENETAGELMERLAPIGAALLKDTLAAIAAGTVTRTPQDPALATYAPILTKELSPIDWTQPARAILAQIRGLNPWPAATSTLGGVEFKIWEARPFEDEPQAAPGTPIALTKKGLAVACGDGSLLITRLQAPGGKAMAAADYFRGHPIQIDN